MAETTRTRRAPTASPQVSPAGTAPGALDWSLVRAFLAVLDAGSLSAAAQRTGLLQPTLSRQVAALEGQLGVPLFERTGRGVTPTAAARAMADGARQMADGAEALMRQLQRGREATAGTVRLTTSAVAASHLLPPVLADLQRVEPGIEVELVASNQLTNLLRREADIAVRMARPVQTSLVARRLGELPIVAAAHERYLARAGVPQRPADLVGHRLIGYDRDDTIRRGFAALGLTLPPEAFALRTDDQLAYGQLVAAGAGVGFVARYNLAHWPGVRPLLPMLAIPPLPCWLAVHREIRGNPRVRRVFDFLAEALPARLAALHAEVDRREACPARQERAAASKSR